MRYWKQAVTVVALEAVLFAVITLGATPALAGDTYPNGGSTWAGNGDCWQPQTPWMCRATWTGRGSQIYMRIIDQLSDNQLHNDARLACNNWSSAPGPQWCSYNARSNDTWAYLKRNDSIPAPNGITFNCVPGSCPTSNNAGNIVWTEISVPRGNLNRYTICGFSGYFSTQIFAHERGHGYGLAHHGSQCSNQTLMTQGQHSFLGPTNIDIGPFPGCSGGPGRGGVRCIYEQT
jgi:hypothetical protein